MTRNEGVLDRIFDLRQGITGDFSRFRRLKDQILDEVGGGHDRQGQGQPDKERLKESAASTCHAVLPARPRL